MVRRSKISQMIKEENKKVIKPGAEIPPSTIDEILGEPNRVSNSIRKMRVQIEERIESGKTTALLVEQTRKNLDIDCLDHAVYQELKSLALTHEKLTQSEAQTVYNLLGECHETFNKQPVEVKIVLTIILGELLEWKLTVAGYKR